MENTKKLLEALKTDAALAEKLKEAGKAYEGKELTDEERRAVIETELLPIIKAAGYDVTMEELEDFAKPPLRELSDDELDAVAGGASKGFCICPIVGGGGGTTPYGNTFACACVAYGQGGDGKNSHWNCICALGGEGNSVGFI